MINKGALLVAVMVAVTYCCYAKEIDQEQLKKDYVKINNYLEKHTDIDKPIHNMELVERLLDEKSSGCKLFGNLRKSSMIDSLKLLVEFSNLPSDFGCNTYKGRRIMHEVDSGLADESRNKNPQYPLTRLDRIIEHYAFENALRCKFDNIWPQMDFGYKQLAYDKINSILVESLPGNDDIKTNMDKARDIRNQQHDGPLTEAFDQFLMLNSILDKSQCYTVGYRILLKNDLATKGFGHAWHSHPLRRVDKIFQHFARKYEELCRPVLRDMFKMELIRLDQDTYRRVLAYTSSHYLDTKDFPALIESVNTKEVNGEFSVPMLVDYPENLVYKPTNDSIELRNNYKMDSLGKIYSFLKSITINDPNRQYLDSYVDENQGVRVVDYDKLNLLIDRYLFAPCGRFLKSFDQLIQIDEYHREINLHHLTSTKEEFETDRTHHMVHAAYQACKCVEANQDKVMGSLDAYVKNHSSYLSVISE